MLVLSRKLGERVFVGDSLIITITEIDRNKVKLGFECDKGIGIYREEIYNQIEKTRLESEKLWREHNARSEEDTKDGPTNKETSRD